MIRVWYEKSIHRILGRSAQCKRRDRDTCYSFI